MSPLSITGGSSLFLKVPTRGEKIYHSDHFVRLAIPLKIGYAGPSFSNKTLLVSSFFRYLNIPSHCKYVRSSSRNLGKSYIPNTNDGHCFLSYQTCLGKGGITRVSSFTWIQDEKERPHNEREQYKKISMSIFSEPGSYDFALSYFPLSSLCFYSFILTCLIQ